MKIPKYDKKDPMEYMCTTFIDEFRGLVLAKTGTDSTIDGELLIGFKGELYNICQDFSVGVATTATMCPLSMICQLTHTS